MYDKSIIEQIQSVTADGQQIAFVFGKFNVVHPGHLRLFRFAKDLANYLVVGLLADGSEPEIIFSETERLDGVVSNNWVDFAFVLTKSPEEVIADLRPNVVLMGKEHEGTDHPAVQAVQRYGGTIRFGSGDTRFSSMELLEAELPNTSSITLHSTSYLNRRAISRERLRTIVNRFPDIRALIIGDLIMDEYVDCEPIGMSSEDPTIVVAPLLTQKFVGGAGIVAAHAAALSGKVAFLSVCGQDEPARFAERALRGYGVDAELIPDSSRPTTVKKRYRAHEKTLLRVNQFRDHEIDRDIQSTINNKAKDLLADVDLLILSDFSYGLLSSALARELINEARSRNIFVAADSQSSSQLGDLERFKNVSLLTPTEREARLATRNKYGGLVTVTEQLQTLTGADHVVLTLGAEGLFLHCLTDEKEWDDDLLPSLNPAPKDVAGAGDAFLVVAGLSMTIGATIWEAAYLGAVAAGCQIGRLGNLPIDRGELIRELAD